MSGRTKADFTWPSSWTYFRARRSAGPAAQGGGCSWAVCVATEPIIRASQTAQEHPTLTRRAPIQLDLIQTWLVKHQQVCSMSKKSDCDNNATMENGTTASRSRLSTVNASPPGLKPSDTPSSTSRCITRCVYIPNWGFLSPKAFEFNQVA